MRSFLPPGPSGLAAFTARDGRLLLLLGLLVVLLSLLSMVIGPADVPLSALFSSGDAPATIIMQELRLPRVLLAICVGGTLGLSGAALQGLLRNPLAEPGLVGASSAAALGAVLVLYFGLYTAFPLALPVAAILGALLAVALVYLLAGKDPGILTLILAGTAVSSLAGSVISLAINLSPNPHSASEIVFWLMGSLKDRSLDHFTLSLPFMAVGTVLLLSSGRALDALALGEDTARTLGFSLGRVRFFLVAGTGLAVGAGVAVTGAIGFIGLVVPHLLRPFVGHQPRRLLPASLLGGMALLLAADIGVRLIPTQLELKLGVLTALVGAPFFLALVLKTRKVMS
ncbi:FecCD family ABC transporter permease [Magnetospirillum molischianum]|uniref:Hemin transport system permease protein, HmuU n=1 Tax=Magnetospirillum molischianum DSM 120 TaxID=1150626 RepID=H8FUE8_MAGML|nr:iron ABC transporter permease [Magnetospirillum molischianum]CCG41986.1 Hemin transport system permease protein, HmuU [Magnetospirillum molischianum DSM 120]